MYERLLPDPEETEGGHRASSDARVLVRRADGAMGRVHTARLPQGGLLSLEVAGDTERPLEGQEDPAHAVEQLSLIPISEPTRLLSISYAVFCLTK